MRARIALLAFALLLAAGCGGGGTESAIPGADPGGAPGIIETLGCGSCHTIEGIDGADADVGPTLENFADRLYIAGRLPNTPENLIRWLMDPQAVAPGTLMPDLGVGREDARDIAAYLYSH